MCFGEPACAILGELEDECMSGLDRQAVEGSLECAGNLGDGVSISDERKDL